MSAPDPLSFSPENGHPDAATRPLRTPAAAGRSRSVRPFRFLQSSDFRLDTPCYGVTNFPEGLRDRFVDARYIAAERVFDAAIEHKVDFVVLAGGLLDPRLPGLRGPWFLAGQFRRLANHGINVYWAGATFETRGRWPSHTEISPNVHRLSADQTGVLHGEDGQPIARLLSLSPSMQSPLVESEDVFTIAVQPRCSDVPEQFGADIDYWALGGQSHLETVQVGDVVAHFAGSPQGRSPEETGRHSCSLVIVDTDGSVQIQPVQTDVVGWHHQRIEIDASISWSELEGRIENQLAELKSETKIELALVTWTVTGGGLAVQRLMQPRFNAELLRHLNAGQSQDSRLVWNVTIDAVVEPSQRTRLQQQKTSLGAFLRELDEMSGHVHEMFGKANDGPHPLGAIDAKTNKQILRQVTNEGVHCLIEGEEIPD